MKISYINPFVKHFNERIKPFPYLVTRFYERAKLFVKASDDPILKDHPLTKKKEGMRAFSITGDIRVIYFVKDGQVFFVDIGTHDQVY